VHNIKRELSANVLGASAKDRNIHRKISPHYNNKIILNLIEISNRKSKMNFLFNKDISIASQDARIQT